MTVEERIAVALERIAAVLEQWEPVGRDAEACDHPGEAREDLSTMGHVRWRCLACGHEEQS